MNDLKKQKVDGLGTYTVRNVRAMVELYGPDRTLRSKPFRVGEITRRGQVVLVGRFGSSWTRLMSGYGMAPATEAEVAP